MVNELQQIKVSAKTAVKPLAGCISNFVDAGNTNIELRAVGAGAVNQMYKSLAIASGILANKGIILTIRAGFKDIEEENGNIKTAMIAKVVVQ